MKTNVKCKKINGFTLIEMMVAVFISSIAMTGIISAFIACLRAGEAGETWSIADSQASVVVERIIRGSSATSGLRQFDSDTATLVSDSAGWVFSDSPTNGYVFSKANQTISDLYGNVIGDRVVDADIEPGNRIFELFVEVQEVNGRLESTRSYKTMVQARNF